jgi:hypothetical protein
VAVGVIVATIGAVMAIGGATLFGIFGSDGVLSSDRKPLTTATSALITGVTEIDDAASIADVLGDGRLRLSADAAGGDGVFVGIGPAADVDRYLAGAQTDELTDFEFDTFGSDRIRHAGSAMPAPPAVQDFWVARSAGASRAAIDWKIADGDYRVVLMNADGSRGVAADAKVGVKIPNLPGIGVGFLIAGLVVIAGGAAIVFRGVRS